MTEWNEVLRHIAPHAHASVVDAIAPSLPDAIGAWPELEQAHFLAQAACETAGFTTLVEFGDRRYFQRYDGRRDLGNVYPGDGYRFRGRGIFQLTGRANYRRYGLMRTPDEAATGPVAVRIAVQYWQQRGCAELALRDNLIGVTRKINGGTNGLSSRRAYLARAKHVLSLAADDGPEPAHPQKVRAIQERLQTLGYHMVGKADGQAGSSTTAALAAFQHDQGLPVTGELDEATEAAVWSSDETRPIPTERATGKPEGSRIYSKAKKLVAGGAVVTTLSVPQMLTQAETVQSYLNRLRDIFHPLFGHPALLAAAGGASVVGVAWNIRKARVQDYQTGKTP